MRLRRLLRSSLPALLLAAGPAAGQERPRVAAVSPAAGGASIAVSAAATGKPERLLGLRADAEKGELAIEVWSGGCTEKKDFRVERAGDALTVVRLFPDGCKMMPQRTTIAFTYEELGLERRRAFAVTNPFVGDAVAAALP